MEKESARNYDANAVINGAKSSSGRGVSVFGATETAAAPEQSTFAMFSNMVQPEVKEPEAIDLQKVITEEEEKLADRMVKGFEARRLAQVFEPYFIQPARRTATVTSDKIADAINSAFGNLFSDYIKCEIHFLGNPTEAFNSLRAMKTEAEKDFFKDGLFDCHLVFSPNLKPSEKDKFHNLIEVTSDDGAATKITSPLAKQVAGMNAIMASGNILKLNQATKAVLDPFISDIYRDNNGNVVWDKLESNPNNGVVGQRNNPLGMMNPNNTSDMRNVTIEYLVKVSLSKVINALITLNESEDYAFYNIPENATDEEKAKILTENVKNFTNRIKNNKISINLGTFFPSINGSSSCDPNSFTIILEEIDCKEIQRSDAEIQRYILVKTNAGYQTYMNPAYRGYFNYR